MRTVGVCHEGIRLKDAKQGLEMKGSAFRDWGRVNEGCRLRGQYGSSARQSAKRNKFDQVGAVS